MSVHLTVVAKHPSQFLAIFLCYFVSKIIVYEMKINGITNLKKNNNEQVIVVLFQHH